MMTQSLQQLLYLYRCSMNIVLFHFHFPIDESGMHELLAESHKLYSTWVTHDMAVRVRPIVVHNILFAQYHGNISMHTNNY